MRHDRASGIRAPGMPLADRTGFAGRRCLLLRTGEWVAWGTCGNLPFLSTEDFQMLNVRSKGSLDEKVVKK